MRILIIGDSLSDGTDGRPGTWGVPPKPFITPGQFLAGRLKVQGHSVRIHAKNGRTAHVFVNRQSGLAHLRRELATHRPDRVIIILGTNDMFFAEHLTTRALRRIRDVFKGIPVYHIGPPAFADRLQTRKGRLSYNTLAKRAVRAGRTVFGKRFIDTRPLTKDIVEPAQGRAHDLVHFSVAGAKIVAARWAAALQNATTLPTSRKPVRSGLGTATLLSTGLLWIIERRERLRKIETGTE